MRRDAGQANLELVALIGLVAALLASAVAIAAPAAPGLHNAVTTAFQRGLCVVANQRCSSLDVESCPTRRTATTHSARATIALLKLGGGRTLQIERRSDGSYRITLLEGPDAGFGIQLAAGDATAELARTGGLRFGRTHHVATEAEAQALINKLRRPGIPSVNAAIRGAADLTGLRDSEPDVDHYILAGRQGTDALAGLGFKGFLSGRAQAAVEAQAGVKISAQRREATLYIDLRGDARVAFAALSHVNGSRPRHRRSTNPTAEPVPRSKPKKGQPKPPEPPAGTPKKRTVKLKNPDPITGDAHLISGGHIALTLGDGGQIIGLELIGTRTDGKRTHELRARLDPDAPGLGPALDAWRNDPTSRDALAAIGEAAAAGSALDRRTYAFDSEVSRSGKLVGRGLGAGLTLDKTTQTHHLIEQHSRPPGGIWAQRLDC